MGKFWGLLLSLPIGNTFGFHLGSFITHHFPKRTFIHVFFLDRLSQLKHTGLGAIQSIKLIKRIDDGTEIQQKEVKIWHEKRYGYHDRLPSIHEIDQLLQVSKMKEKLNWDKELKQRWANEGDLSKFLGIPFDFNLEVKEVDELLVE